MSVVIRKKSGCSVRTLSCIHARCAKGPRLSMAAAIDDNKELLRRSNGCMYALAGIPYYLDKGCFVDDAIEFSLDDCIISWHMQDLVLWQRRKIKRALVSVLYFC